MLRKLRYFTLFWILKLEIKKKRKINKSLIFLFDTNKFTPELRKNSMEINKTIDRIFLIISTEKSFCLFSINL